MVSSQSGKRHTSFCQVQVYPCLEDADGAAGGARDIPPGDLRVETMRSQGAGGQHVNTTDSAVRLTHLPTGITVMCQSDRSQHRNRESALRQLRGKLLAREEAERAAARAQQRASLGANAWGSQIRSYVFAPYQMVKDHRTGHKTADVAGVMDGDIDGFVESALLQDL
eukprot:TRINITY_DN7470_c0_g1_i1.p2 TRINITY_DN7470_c0_g1~~TRINITY_DN7470_c0_g1_i1.p2  ORF type:complete len:168 (-),score=55.61 TRINITY_DN7470_c0_g1_i1:142-645(-)